MPERGRILEFSPKRTNPEAEENNGLEILEIVQVEDPNKPPKVLLRCELVDSKVKFDGDEDLVRELRGEKFFWEGKEVTPDDGENFLRAVKAAYRNPYFYARKLK